ncbi:MAG: [FeFe] hydrogenase H-cluster maturation GTPase HydF [Lachnospiraceae bacterium]|nr:[FeFe] hydrogenase H-cluster maturation GTPase HydF [Lachnospiraceae bacterium]
MSLNSTPSANRIHIGFFGRRNAGKSSVVNAVTGQELSVVSDVMGTTTDPVSKAMELLPMGPVLIIDTPGYDDEGALGELRVKKTKEILHKTDVAVLVVDGTVGLTPVDEELIKIFKQKDISYITVYNKCDLMSVSEMIRLSQDDSAILVSATDKKNIDQLKEKIALIADKGPEKHLIRDLVDKGDVVILVTPIDEAAPKGRLILPQQQTIRDLLEADAVTVVVKETEVSDTLKLLNKRPRMIITDSQAFKVVAQQIPADIPLTSFSILMARYKGFLDNAVKSAVAIDNLKDGDRILISEGCTHHRQCGDIGTVKLPAWLEAYTGKKLQFEFTSGGTFPEELSDYKVVIHCGGCTLNERELKYRMKTALEQGVPFTNYGTVIAQTQGIFVRSLEVFAGKYV